MSFYKENRPAQKRFYASKKWQRCRDAYLSEHPCCERCAKRGIVSIAEHVHHIQELDEESYKNPMLSLNFDNLEALCFKCHQEEHHKFSECDEKLYFDANGDLKIEDSQPENQGAIFKN